MIKTICLSCSGTKFSFSGSKTAQIQISKVKQSSAEQNVLNHDVLVFGARPSTLPGEGCQNLKLIYHSEKAK